MAVPAADWADFQAGCDALAMLADNEDDRRKWRERGEYAAEQAEKARAAEVALLHTVWARS